MFTLSPLLVLTQVQEDSYTPRLSQVKKSRLEIGLKNGLTYNLLQIQPAALINSSTLELGMGSGVSNRLMAKIGPNTGLAFLTEPGYLKKSSQLILPGDTTFTISYNIQYISLPLLGTYQSDFQYFLGDIYQQFYINAGLNINVLARATRKTAIDVLDFSQTETITDNVYQVEGSLSLALGSRFLINETSSFYLELRGENGFSNINESLDIFSVNSPNASDIRVSQLGLSILLGFSASIPQKQQEKELRNR